MVTRAAPSRLTARERARRAARGGGSRSVPAPLLVPALIAIVFLILPLAGLLIRAPWARLGAALSGIALDDQIACLDIAEPAQRLIEPSHPEWPGGFGELVRGDAGMDERNAARLLRPRRVSPEKCR